MRLSYGERHGAALNPRNSQLTFAGWEKLSSPLRRAAILFLARAHVPRAHVHTRTILVALLSRSLGLKILRSISPTPRPVQIQFSFSINVPPPLPLHASDPSSPLYVVAVISLRGEFTREKCSRDGNPFASVSSFTANVIDFLLASGGLFPPLRGSWFLALISPLPDTVTRKIIGEFDVVSIFLSFQGWSLRDSFMLTHKTFNGIENIINSKYIEYFCFLVYVMVERATLIFQIYLPKRSFFHVLDKKLFTSPSFIEFMRVHTSKSKHSNHR